MKTIPFNKKTFSYFDLAEKNKNNKIWFDKNKENYKENVFEPLAAIINNLNKEFYKDLPGINISPRSITRPLRPTNRAEREGGLIKSISHITLSEKRTSLFEWNPGIHIQFGAKKDDNQLGLGLYMVSGRQLSLLRTGLVDDFDYIDTMLKDKKFIKAWGQIQGEKYKRFPKGFNPDDPNSAYVWYKQFYLSKHFTRVEVQHKDFTKNMIKDLKLAIPLLKWIRQTVGVYRGNNSI